MAFVRGVTRIQSVRSLTNGVIKRYSTSGSLINVAVNEKTGIATATLQRPPVNSLNLEFLSEISNTLADLEKNKCRGLILTSSSNSVFSAGLDILEMYKPDPSRSKQFWLTLQQAWIKLYGSTFPTVAVINGHAPAGGCLMAMSCEYRIMLNNFTIGLNETQLGMIAPNWFIASMVNIIGHRQSELALTQGRLFKTDEALRIGLVDEVAESKEAALEKAEAFLQTYAKIPVFARALTKKTIREQTIQVLANNLQEDLDIFLGYLKRDDVQQQIGTYLQLLKEKQKRR